MKQDFDCLLNHISARFDGCFLRGQPALLCSTSPFCFPPDVCNKQTLYEVVCYNRNTQPAISFLHLLGAVASLVASLAALVADNLIRTIASKMTRLVAVSADGLVGAVASKVAGLVALAANHESLSLRASRMGATACLFAQAHTSPQGSHEQCGRAFRSCSR